MKKLLLVTTGLILSVALYSQDVWQTKICYVYKGEVVEKQGEYRLASGTYHVEIDGVMTNIDSLQFKSREYALNTQWYINNDVIVVDNAKYQKYGLPRVLNSGDVKMFSTYKNVPMFREKPLPGYPEEKGTPTIIYVPVKANCEFQPYAKVQD